MAKKITRRAFVGGALTAAGTVIAAPAILRGQNLNNKLNLAIIGCGGRGADNLKSVASENIVALCDVNGRRSTPPRRSIRRPGRSPTSASCSTTPSEFDAVVVSTCEHTHAFATLPALQARQARLLREAADAQHLGGPRHPRGRREGEGRHADGHADPRQRQLPPRGRAGPERRDRAGARGARLGRPGVGLAEPRSSEAEQGHRLRHERPAEGVDPVPAGPGLGPVARAGAGAAVQRGLLSRARSGIAGGISATAR